MTKISDAGVEQLPKLGLTNLRFVRANGAGITEAAALRVQKMMPGLQIFR